MTDVFDYLQWRGDLSLEQSPLNEVDGVILARLSYMPFEGIWKPETALTVGDAAKALLALADTEPAAFLREEDIRLLSALGDSPRFGDMKLLDYVNQLDEETQFSATTLGLTGDLQYISFRGTDNTLVGWKEDFNMSFVCPVQAQELAVDYTRRMTARFPGRWILGGHSKGGNLAVYAAAFCEPAIQERIQAVYNYDGPGFDDRVLQTPGYQAICGRVKTVVPQSSIVGLLLGHEEQYAIVHSDQTVMPLQHDIYSWEIWRNRFSYLETVTNGSRFVDFTLKEWIAQMEPQQREILVDTIYEIMESTQAATFRDLSENWFANTKTVLKSLKNLDEDTRKSITQAISLLLKSAKVGLYQVLQSR